MAKRLLAAGHHLTCASRSQGPVCELAAFGADGEIDPRRVVAASDITFLALPDDATVQSLMERVLDDVAGRIVVDCSTVSPATERRVHELVNQAGGAYLDAPVSGGPAGAASGALSVMAGGEPDTLEASRPAMRAFAGRIVHVGPAGAGQVVKLCNQIVVGGQMMALCEAVLLATRAGVDPADLHRVLIESTGDCVMARTRFPVAGVVPSSPASNGWRADFTTALMAKDLALAVAEGAQVGAPTGMAELVHRALLRAVDHGLDQHDWSALIEVLEAGRG